MAQKYWVANNPNSEITDAKAQTLATMSSTVASVSFSISAEATEAITVSCQFKDGAGDDMTTARCLMAYLSADSAGQTAASSSGLTITSGTDGLTQVSVDANTINMIWLTSEADGDVDVVITDASGGTTTNYLNVITPDGAIHTSGAITFA
jgi:hypothetical protein